MLVTSSINSDIGQHLQFLQCFIQGYFFQLALYSAYSWLPVGESIKGSPRDATLFVYAPFSDPIHPQQRICNRLHFLHCCHCHRLFSCASSSTPTSRFPDWEKKPATRFLGSHLYCLCLTLTDLEPSWPNQTKPTRPNQDNTDNNSGWLSLGQFCNVLVYCKEFIKYQFLIFQKWGWWWHIEYLGLDQYDPRMAWGREGCRSAQRILL